jgi:hypothetical protein
MPQENKRLGTSFRVEEWGRKTQTPGERVGHRPRSKRDSSLRGRRLE